MRRDDAAHRAFVDVLELLASQAGEVLPLREDPQRALVTRGRGAHHQLDDEAALDVVDRARPLVFVRGGAGMAGVGEALRLEFSGPDRMTEARAAVLRVIDEHGGAGFAPSELAQLAGVGTSVVKGLVGTGTLVETEAPKDAPYPRLDPSLPGKPLAPDQAVAAEALRTVADDRVRRAQLVAAGRARAADNTMEGALGRLAELLQEEATCAG